MILLFLIKQLMACEFEFIYNQYMKEVSYDVPQADFIAFGIWTRYYAFYLDISIEKAKYQYFGRQFDAYQIMTGSYNDGTYLYYFLIKENGYLNHLLILNSDQDEYYLRIQLYHGEQYEGVWMFTYIGLDNNSDEIKIFLLNTKTSQFQQEQYENQAKQINSIKLFGEAFNKYPFSGQISFTQSQSLVVNFQSGEELLNYQKLCNADNLSCTQNQINGIISGIVNTYNSNYFQIIQDNYWIDGWFIFTPNTQIQKYNNLILQLVQQGRELLNYNGIIPLKISLNFDSNNLSNNGITVEISSYGTAIWNDNNLNSIQVQIFNESYLKLIQNWVYFRFLQYDQVDHNAEFYISFSDQNYVNKNIGQLNLFKYGNLSIYLGQSELNPERFLGQLANINIQSCLQSYPQAKRACHFTCFTCFGPLDNHCLSCVDYIQSYRILNPNTNTCNCKVGLISVEGQVQCMNIEKFMKSATFSQIQQSESQLCKQGQFQYEDECYDCPQQSALGVQCANCLENPQGWQENMMCSYDYYQYNHNENNTFLKQLRSGEKIDYYYFKDDGILICFGCNLNEGSYQITKDKTILYGSCQQNYYYNDSSCYPCGQNCKECEDNTGKCYKCQTSYFIQNQICKECPYNCLICQYTDQIICNQCLEGFTHGNGICYKCATNCLICDFDEKLNRPKCRVCKSSGYFLPFDGIDCVQNTIQNCLIEYQQQIQYLGEIDQNHSPTGDQNGVDLTIRYNIKTTLGFEKIQPPFRPIIGQIITNICALCAPQFMNGDTYCSLNETLRSGEQVLIKNNYGQCCINFQRYDNDGIIQYNIDVCKDEYFEQEGIICIRKILSTELIYLISSQNSHQEVYIYCVIDQCNLCIYVQQKYRCIQCSQGWYPEILSGLCFSCPQSLNCKTCQQQKSKDKDGWKWSIRAYSNYQFQSDLSSSRKKEDYEVICITCSEGYMLLDGRCILKCPTNCQRCNIIDGQNVCTFCGINDKGKLLTIQNNQCSNCPQNCEFCQPRSSNDIYKINNLFNPDDPSLYYYSFLCLKPRMSSGILENQFFQQYFKCYDGEICDGQLNIKVCYSSLYKLAECYCDLESYSKEKSKYQNELDFHHENIYIANNSQLFVNIETPKLIAYLNDIQIESLIYELILISSSNYCSIYGNIISTNLPKNVFSLVSSKLIINANNLTLNSQNAEIQNFSQFQIQQCIFDSHFKLVVKHPNQVIVRFKDAYHVSLNNDLMEILILNPFKIEIQNFQIQIIQNSENEYNKFMIKCKFTNSSTAKYLDIQMDNLQLVKSQFYASFLTLPQMLYMPMFYIKLNVSNSLIQSTFYFQSSFIYQYHQSNYGAIYLNNVTFIIQAYDTSIIQLNANFDVYCSANLTGKLIGQSYRSYFIRTTYQYHIINTNIYDISLQHSSVFSDNIPDYYGYINDHFIENLIFSRVIFDQYSYFITFNNIGGIDSLEIQKILVINCQFISKLQIKSDNSLIIFSGDQFILRNSFFEKSILGLIDISIKLCNLVIIDNIIVQGNNIQGLQNQLNCFKSLVNISLRNSFIKLEDIESIEITNSQFNNLMIQNYPIIGIFNIDDTKEYKIQVRNTTFKNNLILITELKRQASIFQLISTKPGDFSAINVLFTQNIVNQYLQNKLQNSATTFLIEAAQFNITLKDCLFQKNQIFNSSDSILYIQGKSVLVYNSTFTQSNLYNDFILKFIIWGSSSQSSNLYQENIQEIFLITSIGGNAKFVVDELLIKYCIFSHSIAQQGSGFHLTLQNFLQISDTTFIGLRNQVDKDDSQGGSIYISLIALNTTIDIKNSNFENSSSLYDGGAIYIYSRYTTSNITLSQIRIENCFSFKGAFISVYQNKYSTIKVTNISVRNSIQGFNDFFVQFNDLNDNLIKNFHLNSAIFYIQYGSLYISNSTISNIYFSSVIQFNSASNLRIYGMVIQNIQFSAQGLIQIFPIPNINMTTFIQNVEILNCNNVQPQQIICQINKISYINDFQCYNYNNKPTRLIQYPQDLEAKFQCFWNRLLDFTSSVNMIYVDRIQISDYLYISDLNMRNNNCSLCIDGMIRIKSVDINIPEFNNIIFKQLYFQNNSCGSGCIAISQQQDINFPTRRLLQTLYQSRFNIPFTVTFEQSQFVNNSALNGIIIVCNLSLSVVDVQIIKNTGFNLSGGILFLGNQNHNFQIMTSEISDSIGNKGGALYLGNKTISNIELLQILLSSNLATSFGQDLVDGPQALTISLDRGRKLLDIKQITKIPIIIQEIAIKPYKFLGNYTLQQFIMLPSGYNIKKYEYYDEKSKSFKPYNLSLRLIALNNFKQPILNLQNTYCTIQKRKININSQDYGPFEEFVSDINFNYISQDYNLDELIINFDPYQAYDYALQLRFNCSSVFIPIINNSSPYNIIGYSSDYELRMNIRTFKCQRGESYNAQLGTCNLCDASQSYYSVVIKATKCSVQDDITMKSVKSTLIELRKNYWRPYDDNNIVTYCYNFPVNCNGGWSPGDESCAQGHIGALCEQCDLYNIKGNGSFTVSGQFQCSSCSDLSLNTLQIFLIITWTLISIIISVKGNVENVDELIIRMKGIKVGFVCVYFERVQLAVLMKILTNYLQIISSIGTFQLQLPPGLKSVFIFSGNPIKSAMYALDCLLVQLSKIQIIYFRNIWFLFMPIYYTTIIFIIYFLLVKIKYMEFKITVLSTTLIFIFIYVQPDIIGSFISLLSFRKISQVYWVQGNVSYLYFTSEHAKWLLSFVVPILIVFGFLIPIILYLKVSKYKAKLNDTFVLRVYGYLYNEYSKVTYYWEIIKICQKELIIIFLTFYEDTIIIEGTIVFLIIFCYDVLSKRFKPYKRLDLNKLDTQCSNVCGFSIVIGMAIYFADSNGNTEILWPFYLFLGIFNIYFIIRLIILLILGYLDKLADQIDQIKDYINNKYPNISLKYPQLQKYLENSKTRSKRVKQRFLKLRKHLWEKIKNQRKHQQPEADFNQEIKQNELKQDSINQEFKDDQNQSIKQQLSQEKSKNQSIIPPLDVDQEKEKIDILLDVQKSSNRQFTKSDQDNNKEKQQRKNRDSQKSIPIEIQNIQEFDFMLQEQDLQNNKDDEEQVNLSIQQ